MKSYNTLVQKCARWILLGSFFTTGTGYANEVYNFQVDYGLKFVNTCVVNNVQRESYVDIEVERGAGRGTDPRSVKWVSVEGVVCPRAFAPPQAADLQFLIPDSILANPDLIDVNETLHIGPLQIPAEIVARYYPAGDQPDLLEVTRVAQNVIRMRFYTQGHLKIGPITIELYPTADEAGSRHRGFRPDRHIRFKHITVDMPGIPAVGASLMDYE